MIQQLGMVQRCSEGQVQGCGGTGWLQPPPLTPQACSWYRRVVLTRPLEPPHRGKPIFTPTEHMRFSHSPPHSLSGLRGDTHSKQGSSFTTRGTHARSEDGGHRDLKSEAGAWNQVSMAALPGPQPTESWLAQIRNQTVNRVFRGVYFCSPNGSVNMSQINYPLCKGS